MKDIEIIGEAANKVSATVRDTAPAFPWRDIVGMRNQLIHAYFDVEPEFVWETVSRRRTSFGLKALNPGERETGRCPFGGET